AFKMQLNGKTFGTQAPEIKCDLKIDKGIINRKAEGITANAIQISATYNSGKKPSDAILQISNMSCALNDFPIRGNCTIKNLKQPYIDLYVKGKTPINLLIKLLKPAN